MDRLPLRCDEPAVAFRRLSTQPWAILFDSVPEPGERSRYSYALAEPFSTVTAVDGQVYVDDMATPGDPWTVFRHVLDRHAAAMPDPHAADGLFCGGAAGVLGYELGRYLERLPARHGNPAGTPDLAMGFYDAVATFDRETHSAWVTISRPQAWERGRRLAAALEAPAADQGTISCGRWHSEIATDDYKSRVATILDYIHAGDIYQAAFTQRFISRPTPANDAYAVYERLRALNPAPFAAFVNAGPALTVISASPERFLSLSASGAIETRPIKGTMSRVADAAEDAERARRLAASVKDRAENLMIVDLLRNDIGRVAVTGSVVVPTLYGIETFSQVHHMVSVVRGQLRPGLGPVDLLRAAFPGGSVTGAPKVRAMEIIDELEAARRGPYCGSVAWIGFDGAMDSSVVIRTLCLTGEGMIAQAGGGIVADSTPDGEHAEMLLKARALLQTVDADWR